MPEENKEGQQPSSQAGEDVKADGDNKDSVKVKENDENKDVEYYKSKAEALEKEIAEKKEKEIHLGATIASLKRDKKQLQKELESEEEDKEIEPDKIEELEQKFERRLQQVQKLNNEQRAKELAQRLTKNPEEAKLVYLTYKSKIVPSGDLQKDIDDAYAMVSGQRIREEMSELERAKKAKETAGKAGNSSQQIYTPPQAQADYDEATRDFIKKRGVKVDPKTGKAISPARQKWEKKMKEQFPDMELKPLQK